MNDTKMTLIAIACLCALLTACMLAVLVIANLARKWGITSDTLFLACGVLGILTALMFGASRITESREKIIRKEKNAAEIAEIRNKP